MTRSEIVERILFAVDGYRFGEWPISEAGARIGVLIEQNPQATAARRWVCGICGTNNPATNYRCWHCNDRDRTR